MTDMTKIKADRDDVNPNRVRHMHGVRAAQRRSKWLGLQSALARMSHDHPGRSDATAELRAIEAEMRAAGQEP